MMAQLRKATRLGVAYSLHYSKLLNLREGRPGKPALCILGLHRVLTREQQERCNSLDSMVVRDTTFTAMVRYLKGHFEVMPLSALIAGTFGTNSGRPACVLTFDDGWRDNFATAFPILKDAKVPASVFLATGFIGTARTFWVEQVVRAARGPGRPRFLLSLSHVLGLKRALPVPALIERLKGMSGKERRHILEQVMSEAEESSGDEMMSWEEAQELSHQGVEFGAHTVSHPLLTHEDDETVRWELQASKQMIEERLKTQVTAFAYPNGARDARVRSLVESAGYKCAVTTEHGWYRPGMDRYSIRRVLLHEGCLTGVTGRFSPAAFHWTLAHAQ